MANSDLLTGCRRLIRNGTGSTLRITVSRVQLFFPWRLRFPPNLHVAVALTGRTVGGIQALHQSLFVMSAIVPVTLA